MLWKVSGFSLAAFGLVIAGGYAVAQMTPSEHPLCGHMGYMSSNDGKGPMQGHHRMMQEMMQRMHGMGQHGMMHDGQPTMPGQDAFGAIQESSASSKPTRTQIGRR
jgi:hypothetical protein